MTLFSFWTLFALATVVLAAGGTFARRRWVDFALLTSGFLAGLTLALTGWSIPPAALAAGVALLAGIFLLRPSALGAGLVAAGALCAQSSVFLIGHGAPEIVAWGANGALAVLAFAYGVRPGFAPAVVREEALLLLLALGLVLAAAPEVVSGWNSAMVLNASASAAAGEGIPGWVWIGVGAALMAGAMSRWWRRN